MRRHGIPGQIYMTANKSNIWAKKRFFPLLSMILDYDLVQFEIIDDDDDVCDGAAR